MTRGVSEETALLQVVGEVAGNWVEVLHRLLCIAAVKGLEEDEQVSSLAVKQVGDS